MQAYVRRPEVGWTDVVCAFSELDQVCALVVGLGVGGGDLHLPGTPMALLVSDSLSEACEAPFQRELALPEEDYYRDWIDACDAEDAAVAGRRDEELLRGFEASSGGSVADRLESAFRLANARLRARSASPKWRGSAALAVAAHVDESAWTFVHSGIAGAFLVREGALVSAIRPHSLSNEAGGPAWGQGSWVAGLGYADEARIERTVVPRREGDALILCSHRVVDPLAALFPSCGGCATFDRWAPSLVNGVTESVTRAGIVLFTEPEAPAGSPP